MRKFLLALGLGLMPALCPAITLTLHTTQPTHSWKAGVDLAVGADTLIAAGSVSVDGEATFAAGSALNSTWVVYQETGATRSTAVFYTTNYDSVAASGHLLDVHCVTPSDTLHFTGGTSSNWVRDSSNNQFEVGLSGTSTCHCEPESHTNGAGALVRQVTVKQDSFVIKVYPPQYFAPGKGCSYCIGDCPIHEEYGPRTRLQVTLHFIAAAYSWVPVTVAAPVGWDSISSQKVDTYFTPCYRPGWFDNYFSWYERVYEAPPAVIDSLNNYYLGGNRPTPWQFTMAVPDGSAWGLGMVTPAPEHLTAGNMSNFPPNCNPCQEVIVNWTAADSLTFKASSAFYMDHYRWDFPQAR